MEQAQHCTDLSRLVTFSAHTEQRKMGQDWDERYCSSREGEKLGDEEGQENEKEKEKTGDQF